MARTTPSSPAPLPPAVALWSPARTHHGFLLTAPARPSASNISRRPRPTPRRWSAAPLAPARSSFPAAPSSPRACCCSPRLPFSRTAWATTATTSAAMSKATLIPSPTASSRPTSNRPSSAPASPSPRRNLITATPASSVVRCSPTTSSNSRSSFGDNRCLPTRRAGGSPTNAPCATSSAAASMCAVRCRKSPRPIPASHSTPRCATPSACPSPASAGRRTPRPFAPLSSCAHAPRSGCAPAGPSASGAGPQKRNSAPANTKRARAG